MNNTIAPLANLIIHPNIKAMSVIDDYLVKHKADQESGFSSAKDANSRPQTQDYVFNVGEIFEIPQEGTHVHWKAEYDYTDRNGNLCHNYIIPLRVWSKAKKELPVRDIYESAFTRVKILYADGSKVKMEGKPAEDYRDASGKKVDDCFAAWRASGYTHIRVIKAEKKECVKYNEDKNATPEMEVKMFYTYEYCAAPNGYQKLPPIQFEKEN